MAARSGRLDHLFPREGTSSRPLTTPQARRDPGRVTTTFSAPLSRERMCPLLRRGCTRSLRAGWRLARYGCSWIRPVRRASVRCARQSRGLAAHAPSRAGEVHPLDGPQRSGPLRRSDARGGRARLGQQAGSAARHRHDGIGGARKPRRARAGPPPSTSWRRAPTPQGRSPRGRHESAPKLVGSGQRAVRCRSLHDEVLAVPPRCPTGREPRRANAHERLPVSKRPACRSYDPPRTGQRDSHGV